MSKSEKTEIAGGFDGLIKLRWRDGALYLGTMQAARITPLAGKWFYYFELNIDHLGGKVVDTYDEAVAMVLEKICKVFEITPLQANEITQNEAAKSNKGVQNG